MSILLSKQHGVNPGMDLCYICLEAHSVILYGRLPDDREAPRNTCRGDICDKCKEHQKMGIILISIRDGEGDKMQQSREDARREWSRYHSDKPFFHLDNPYRTGGHVVVTEEMVDRFLEDKPELLASVKKHRMMFLEQSVWDGIGLPATPETPAATTSNPTTEHEPTD